MIYDLLSSHRAYRVIARFLFYFLYWRATFRARSGYFLFPYVVEYLDDTELKIQTIKIE